jgi:hypothetical protein
MRKASLFLCALLLLSCAGFGQNLSQTDRDQGLQYLEQTRDGVIAATKGLSDTQMKFKPVPDRWSVAEVVEHITRVEDGIFQNVTLKVMKAPAGAADREPAKMDAMVLTMVPDRSHKRQAPPEFVPTDSATPAETLDHFLKTRAKTFEFLQSTPDLRAHVADSPLGPLDAYEWLLFTSAHSERHTKQILELKADPNFPKN